MPNDPAEDYEYLSTLPVDVLQKYVRSRERDKQWGGLRNWNRHQQEYLDALKEELRRRGKDG